MKLIDNLQTKRICFYLSKVNNNLLKFKYILFCYNIQITPLLTQSLVKNKISYYFLKDIKSFKYFKIININLTNYITAFGCDNKVSLRNLLPLIEKNLLISKINKTFYSINNLKTLSFNSHLAIYNTIVSQSAVALLSLLTAFQENINK